MGEFSLQSKSFSPVERINTYTMEMMVKLGKEISGIFWAEHQTGWWDGKRLNRMYISLNSLR